MAMGARVSALVGSGWGKDNAEALSNLVGNVTVGVLTGGEGDLAAVSGRVALDDAVGVAPSAGSEASSGLAKAVGDVSQAAAGEGADLPFGPLATPGGLPKSWLAQPTEAMPVDVSPREPEILAGAQSADTGLNGVESGMDRLAPHDVPDVGDLASRQPSFSALGLDSVESGMDRLTPRNVPDAGKLGSRAPVGEALDPFGTVLIPRTSELDSAVTAEKISTVMGEDGPGAGADDGMSAGPGTDGERSSSSPDHRKPDEPHDPTGVPPREFVDSAPATDRAIGELAHVPTEVFNKVWGYMEEVPGGGMSIGAKPLTQLPGGDVLGDAPRGWPEGSTWDDVAGVWVPSERRLLINSEGASASGSVALHEFGHAVDYAYGKLIDQPEWLDLHQGTMKELSENPSWNGYYYHPEEFFAEAFGAWSKGPGALRDFSLGDHGVAGTLEDYFGRQF